MESADANFVTALLLYLGFASMLLYRNPGQGSGFSMFVFVYAVFLLGFWFASTTVVLIAWLALSIANMAYQLVALRHHDNPTGTTGLLVASVFLWPIQFATAVSSRAASRTEAARKTGARERIGPVPATITGTVSYTHHIDADDGYDALWLKEFDELEFMTASKLFDDIGIEEDKVFSLTIEERDIPNDVGSGKILWVTGGNLSAD